MLYLIIFIIIHLISAILAYGITFAYFQKKYPIWSKDHYFNDLKTSLIVSTFGLIGLIISYLYCNFAKHGLKFK